MNTKHRITRKSLIITVFLLLSWVALLADAAERNTTTTVSQVSRSVTVSTAVDYKVTSATPFTSAGSVNITNDRAVLILASVKPSAVVSSWMAFIKVNGAAAVNGTNCQVKMYAGGAIVLPYGDNVSPLTCYSEPGFTGEACSSYTTGSDGGYMKTLGNGELPNRIRSFKLRRGYMVTFATGTAGWGYSRCFIADDVDLEMATMPAVLDAKISSYRIFKWNDAQKKGLAANTDGTVAGALNASWAYTWGVGSDMGPDVECVQHKIHKNWPGVGECGAPDFSPHMKTDNEPANSADDTPASVSEVLGYWQDAMRTGKRLCSPSSHDGGYAWQQQFMEAIDRRGWRCDILDMHCYWPSGSFPSLQNYYNQFHRPIWISELLWGASWNSNGIFGEASDWDSNSTNNQTLNYNGAKPVLDALNGYGYVERYAWWNSERVCSRVYHDGALTKLGSYYASMESGLGFSHSYEFVPVVVIANPYALRITADGDHVSLTWKDGNGDMMDEIQVQYRRPGDSTWSLLATVERQDKTDRGDQSYAYEGTLADAEDCTFRIVNYFDGVEYPTMTDEIVGSEVIYNGGTYYLGGNVIANGDFSYGFTAWTDGTGNSSPAKSKLEVIPVAGPDNSAYLRSYGHTGATGDASLRGAFTVVPNQPYRFTLWHKNHEGGWQKASLSTDGSAESKEVSNLETVDEWKKVETAFQSDSYSHFIIQYRWLNSTAKFDKFALRRLFTTQQEAFDDGFTQLQSEAEAFKSWNTATFCYADINAELTTRLNTFDAMPHADEAAALARYEAALTALQEALAGVKTKKTLDSLLVFARRVADESHPLYRRLQTAIANATAATTVGGYSTTLADLQSALSGYLSLEDVTSLIKNPTFTSADGWTTKAGSYTGGDQRLNNIWGRTCWNAWWSTADAGTLEVKQTLQNLPEGYYYMACVATTQPFCITDQHGYISNGTATEQTPTLTFERFDSPGITNEDVWEPLATLPVWVDEGGSLTIGFQSSKQGKQTADPVYSDNREGWWCATDFRLFRYQLPDWQLGDVNRDGQLSIADVTALVNHLRGVAGDYNLLAADVSQDGEIALADVGALVLLLLGK